MAIDPAKDPVLRHPASLNQQPLRRRGGHYVELCGPEVGVPGLEVLRVTLGTKPEPGHLHVHRGLVNTYVALTGDLVVRTAGEDVTVRAGDAIVIRPGIPHATENPGTAPIEFLAIYDGRPADDFELVG